MMMMMIGTLDGGGGGNEWNSGTGGLCSSQLWRLLSITTGRPLECHHLGGIDRWSISYSR